MDFKPGKPLMSAMGAGTLLFIFYFLILVLANSLSHALSEFLRLWYWILILIFGFSFQAYLYFYIRERQKALSLKILAGSGGVSSGSMVACCLHHLSDVLPVMGLAGAALFLVQYQIFFIAIGVISNIIGIIIMLEIIRKNNLAKGFLEKISVQNFAGIKKTAIALSLILLPIIFFSIKSAADNKAAENLSYRAGNLESPKKDESLQKITLEAKTDERGGVAFEVTPINLNFGEPLNFGVKIDTHSGSLDFDLAKASILQDDKGNKYSALQWQGPPPGGHHLSGTLIFPTLKGPTKIIKIEIRDNPELSPRIFEWNL